MIQQWSIRCFGSDSKFTSRSIQDIGFTPTMWCAYLCLWCEFPSTLCFCRRFGLCSWSWLTFSRHLFIFLVGTISHVWQGKGVDRRWWVSDVGWGWLCLKAWVPCQLCRSWHSRGNFKFTVSIYVHLLWNIYIWSTRERLEVWFKEVKRLRRHFNNSEMIQFHMIHLTQNFVPESNSESPPESTWSVYSESYYWLTEPSPAGISGIVIGWHACIQLHGIHLSKAFPLYDWQLLSWPQAHTKDKNDRVLIVQWHPKDSLEQWDGIGTMVWNTHITKIVCEIMYGLEQDWTVLVIGPG